MFVSQCAKDIFLALKNPLKLDLILFSCKLILFFFRDKTTTACRFKSRIMLCNFNRTRVKKKHKKNKKRCNDTNTHRIITVEISFQNSPLMFAQLQKIVIR